MCFGGSVARSADFFTYTQQSTQVLITFWLAYEYRILVLSMSILSTTLVLSCHPSLVLVLVRVRVLVLGL